MRSPALLLIVVLVALISVPFDLASASTIRAVETPQPSVGSEAAAAPVTSATDVRMSHILAAPRNPFNAPPLGAPAINCFNYDTNSAVAGTLLVPPDPHCAAGPDHAIVIGNVIIEWRPKVGMVDLPEYQSSLKNFFIGLPGVLGTSCFDPKVVYDQYADRFVVVALERTDGGAGENSRILVGISKTSNPNDGWWLHSINSKLLIGGLNRWIDYPGLAVDDKAIYITGNMFAFAAGGSGYGGARVWVMNKTPAYSGPNNNFSAPVYDPYLTPGSVATTTQPAHMFGPVPNGSGGRPLGTFLVSAGLVDGAGNDFIQVLEMTDPLATAGGPFFAVQFIDMGNIDSGVALPDAPQLGQPTYPIEVNDRRALNAVWRADNLYTTSEILPIAGADAGQTTAHWVRINTSVVMPGLTLADQGNIGAEDLGAGTYTFYPSVMVDAESNMAVGFSASNANIYCGAYYTTRLVGDPPGTVSPTGTLQAGLAPYKRFHSGNRNRWGDYSGIALCPADEGDFYVFNEYAGPVGTPGNGFNGPEDGRWFTKLGWFRVMAPTPVGAATVSTRLAQNIPNPFNPSTTIHFTLAARARATVAVYDAHGQLVRTLVDEDRSAGQHDVQWDGRDSGGKAVASGVYFYRLAAGSVVESKKMVLLK